MSDVIRVLRDIPNRPGFRFIGVDLNGAHINCTVKLDPTGCCSVYTDDGDPCFFRLVGWLHKDDKP